MSDEQNFPDDAAVSSAARHALGWFVFGNLVGLYLSILLLQPSLQLGQWTYGRWVPVHLNVQLYGWTSLPLVAWLFSIYEVNRSKAQAWAPAAVWAWTTALAIGALHWLGGVTSGKIFLDWKGGALWALIAAQVVLWHLLASAWNERRHHWNPRRTLASFFGLAVLAMVPLSLAFASSPAVYPPVDRTTGGPSGSSLLGSTLIVINLMVLLPRVAALASKGKAQPEIWMYLAFSWLFFAVTEAIGGTHFDGHQIAAMAVLLPWVWLLPRDWARFSWPNGSRIWQMAMFSWWAILVVSGFLMYQPGVLDRIKFTQGLVAHSHLAMAGFTTAFCALLIVMLTGKPMASGRSVWLWNLAAFVMIVVLALMGWREGGEPSWMLKRPDWRTGGLLIRALCGLLMLAVSLNWLFERRKS